MEPKRKPYHHGNLKQALIDQGLLFLGSHSPDELSLRELARASGVSPNAPYRHFKTKEELLGSLANFGFEQLADSLDAVQEDGPMKRFRAMGGAVELFSAENAALFRLMLDGRLAVSIEGRDRCFTILAESARVLMDEVTINEKVIHATQAAWSLFAGFSLIKISGGFGQPAEMSLPDAREVARMLGRGLRD